MTKDRKTLKEYSIVILILAGLTLVRIIVDACITGFNPANVNIEGASETLIKVSLIIAFVLALVLLIPDVYVGIKGIKEANNPSGAKAHIIWALIIAIIYALGTVSSIVDICKGFSWSNLTSLCNTVLDACIFTLYYLTAKKVAEEK